MDLSFLFGWIKDSGPWAIGWLLAAYLLNDKLQAQKAMQKDDIESRVKLAVTLETLTTAIRSARHDGN